MYSQTVHRNFSLLPPSALVKKKLLRIRRSFAINRANGGFSVSEFISISLNVVLLFLWDASPVVIVLHKNFYGYVLVRDVMTPYCVAKLDITVVCYDLDARSLSVIIVTHGFILTTR